MTATKKIFLSCCTLVVFALFALSSKVNNIHFGAFNYANRVEDPSDLKNFLLLDDGTKVHGDRVSWKSGILVKDQIRIDDQKFKITEVKGYQTGGVFYARFHNDYIKRIVRGSINVYVKFTQVTTTSTDNSGFMHTSTYTRTDQYGQKGDDGPMIGLASHEDIQKMVADCPIAVEMASKSNKEMRKAIRKNRNYLNSIFDVYNNGCKPIPGE
jgi:hypothetical protein